MRSFVPRLFAWTMVMVAGSAFAGPFERPFVDRNPIPPRLQWNANNGYCGEVSFISAGLFYGQYVSQYEARRAAIGRTPQHRGELLLGVNERRAARVMRLDVVVWPTERSRNPARFLAWVKRHVLRGRPVIIGVYNNEFLLYGNPNPSAGDPQYDHIVPVTGVGSRRPLREEREFPDDVLIFSDNGLFGTGPTRQFIYRAEFRRFPASRAAANAPTAPVYSLPDYGRNFGVAVTGVVDRDGTTLPVRVQTSVNAEHPAMRRGSNLRPPSRPLTLTVTISGLTPGVVYHLYRYNRLESIPDGRFNARASAAAEIRVLTINSGSTFTFAQRIRSDEVAAYRCVPAAAP